MSRIISFGPKSNTSTLTIGEPHSDGSVAGPIKAARGTIESANRNSASSSSGWALDALTHVMEELPEIDVLLNVRPGDERFCAVTVDAVEIFQ